MADVSARLIENVLGNVRRGLMEQRYSRPCDWRRRAVARRPLGGHRQADLFSASEMSMPNIMLLRLLAFKNACVRPRVRARGSGGRPWRRRGRPLREAHQAACLSSLEMMRRPACPGEMYVCLNKSEVRDLTKVCNGFGVVMRQRAMWRRFKPISARPWRDC